MGQAAAQVGAGQRAQQVSIAALRSSQLQAQSIASLLANSAAAANPSDASGIALVEVYEADNAAPRLINLSSRMLVGAGEQIGIPGVVVRGASPKKLLIRAVGPGLAPFGVAGLLADPQIGLVPSGAAEPIASNDNWADLAELRTAFTDAGAFPLTAGSKDAVLVVTLEPGAYTVIVSGASGSVNS